MRSRAAILLVTFLSLVGPASTLGAGPFQRLDGRTFQGRSIIGANGKHPVRNPTELNLYFRTADLTGVASPTLAWKGGCNGHNYLLSFVHQRLHTSGQISTQEPCVGSKKREERWLENFFAVDLAWSLRHGRLTLTAGQRQIVLIGKWLLSTNH